MPYNFIPKSAFKKGSIPWNKGKTGVYSKETIERMVSLKRGKKLTEEHCRKISLGNLGRIVSTETRRKISLSNMGKQRSDKTRKILSELNLGKTLSVETRVAMSKSRMGRRVSNQTKEKIKMALIGKSFSKTHKINVGISNRKKAKDPNILSKIREARLKQIFPMRDTKPERMMQIALSLHGIKYQKHKSILGQPDIFIEPNICIFVDGDYSHANPTKYKASDRIYGKLAAEKWARDSYVTHELSQKGYQVIRIWASVIIKDANTCAEKIILLIKQNMNGVSILKEI